ncbi:cytochrome P450 [Polychaeton citri CBS 116435]|uniref:Cytochrome P450 n=1 Tax=Polychaeton citri CBS 116435 TaxID=1314669 RepID=A0A9P4QCI5_9PEZI|nr:cytochrome P450 [Polychaeton citri CBS 116435]
MTVSVGLLGLVGIACLLIYRTIIQPAFLSPLTKIPKPHWSCAISTIWFDRQKKQKRVCKTLYAAHEKHGEIIQLSPEEVSVVSPEGIRQIYTYGLEKDPWYGAEFSNYGTPNLVSMLDHKSHSLQKRMITSVYAKSFVLHSDDFLFVRDLVVEQKWLPSIQKIAAAGEPTNVLSLSQWAGADFTTAYLFGSANGTTFLLDEEEGARDKYFTPLTGTTFDSKPYMEDHVMSKCKSALAVLGDEPEGSSKPVVFSKLYNGLKASSKSGIDPKFVFNDEDILKRCASEMFDHNIAGHETTSITLTYAFWQLSQHPELQARLRKEILDASDGLEEQTSFSLPSPSKLDALPLLHAVLFETLRLHAAAPAQQPRVVRTGGMELHGFFIPEGTRVSANAYTFHRHAQTYENPFTWQPERWLTKEGDGAEAEKRLMRWFWAFGSGGRMCIGSNFAVAMLKSLIACVYGRYTTTIVDDEGIEQADDFIAGPIGGKLILKFHEVNVS